MDWVYLIDVRRTFDDFKNALYFRVLTKSGEVSYLKSAESLNIDGTMYKLQKSGVIDNAYAAFTNASGIVKSQVVKIRVNENSEVAEIDTMKLVPDVENAADSVHCIQNYYKVENGAKINISRKYKTISKIFDSAFAVADGATIFKVPDTAESEDKGDYSQYIVIKADSWLNDSDHVVAGYNMDVNSLLADVVVEAKLGTEMAAQQYVTVVSGVKQAVNEDDEVAMCITGYQNNVEKSWFLNSKEVAKISKDTFRTYTDVDKNNGAAYFNVDKGDTIRFDVMNDGKIGNIQVIYDYSEREYRTPSGSADLLTYGIFQTGLVKPYRIERGYITFATDISLSPEDPDNTLAVFGLSSYRIYKVEEGRKGPLVTVAKSTDIKDCYNYGMEYNTQILVQNRYNEGRTIVIYK